jgi:hypothetical protein
MCVKGEIQVAVGKAGPCSEQVSDIIKKEYIRKANLKHFSKQVKHELLLLLPVLA